MTTLNPRLLLHDIERITRHLISDWSRFVQTSDDLAAGGDRLGVHGGDTPDPTLAATYARAAVTDSTAELIEAHGILRRIEDRVTAVTREHPATARQLDAAARAARCSDPVCTDNAVKHGHCERHWWVHRDTCATCTSGGAA